MLKEDEAVAEHKLVIIGDKAKAALQKYCGKQILFSCNDLGRLPPTFEDASIIAAKILSSDYKFDKVGILSAHLLKFSHRWLLTFFKSSFFLTPFPAFFVNLFS